MIEPLAKMEGIVKSFPGVLALDGVSLEVRPGEVHALVGENGSGKSTLIRILSGEYQADGGRIIYDGREVWFRAPSESLRRGIAVISQEVTLATSLTVAENIFLGRLPAATRGRLVSWNKTNEMAARILSGLNLRVDPRTKVGQLRPDEQQMIEIARAVSMDAKLIVMDEPTSSLTEDEVQTLFSIVRSLKSKGVSIIFISQRLREVMAIADRATVLRDGRVVGVVDVAATDEKRLVSLMVGRSIGDFYGRARPALGAPVLSVAGVSCGSKVRDASFEIRAGEVLGVAGLVGAGRTELAEALFGLRRREKGEIRICGRKVDIRRPADAFASGLALVPEDRKRLGLVLSMSVKQNLLMCQGCGSGSFRLAQGRRQSLMVDHFMRRLRVKAASVDTPVKWLSGGNQQKITIGKSLATNPKVLLLDEPTRGIDIGAKAEVYRLIGEIASSGTGILVISSELPELLGISDRIVVMFRGQIVRDMPIGEATEELIAYYATGGH